MRPERPKKFYAIQDGDAVFVSHGYSSPDGGIEISEEDARAICESKRKASAHAQEIKDAVKEAPAPVTVSLSEIDGGRYDEIESRLQHLEGIIEEIGLHMGKLAGGLQ